MCFCWSIFGQQLIFVVGIFHTKTPTHSFDQKPAPHPKQILSVLTFENYNKVVYYFKFLFSLDSLKNHNLFLVSLETWYFHFFYNCLYIYVSNCLDPVLWNWHEKMIIWDKFSTTKKYVYTNIPIMFHETMTEQYYYVWFFFSLL